MELFKLLINGKEIDTGKYEYLPYADKIITDFKTVYKLINTIKKGNNPSNINDYIYAKYCVSDENTNKKAIESAYKASQSFRYFPVIKRRKILDDIYKNLINKKDDLIKLFVIEGHPRKLAEWEFSGMEKAYRPESLDFFKDELWTEVGRGDHETTYLARKPDGVVCLSPPKNAPCSNSLVAGFALLGGNTLVVKPPIHTPLSTTFLWNEIVWKAARDNDAPNGTINIVIGNAKKIIDEWIENPLINDIIFFGTSDKGLEIGKQIYLSGKKPILELSGNDVMLIWKDGDMGNASDALLDAFLGSTQICMVPKAALIHGDIYEEFITRFLPKVRQLKVGLPSDIETCLTPVVKMKEFYEFLDDAINKGAKVLYGSERIDYKGNIDEKGGYIRPAVISIEDSNKALDMKCVKEENFFPMLPLVKIAGSSDKEIFEKMMKILNANEYGLRTSVWVKSYYYTRRFIRYINISGLLRINSRHVGFSSFLSTHGGTGKTGGPYGEMNYIWQKTTHLQGISLTREKVPGR